MMVVNLFALAKFLDFALFQNSGCI